MVLMAVAQTYDRTNLIVGKDLSEKSGRDSEGLESDLKDTLLETNSSL